MSARSRLVALLTMLLLTLTLSGIAVAQTDSPDPDAPVKGRTPTPTDDDDSVTPTDEPDSEPTRDESEETASPTYDATPGGDATPVASAGDANLAAMTLDSNTIPEDFFLIAEYYTSPQEIVDGHIGQIEEEDLFATGMQTFYQSFYMNSDGNTIRTYIISYETADGVQAGFDLLEDEELLVPNGDLVDLPGLEGVGETPSEITSGVIERGDGTQEQTYDISFRIDRFEVGAAMETYDGAEIDEDLVEQLAVDIAERVEAVIAGDDLDGVDYNLPSQLISLDVEVQLEGYQTASEAFLIDDPEILPDGFTSGFFRGGSFSNNITTLLPFVTVGISSFDSADDVEAAMDDTDSIMPSYPDLDEIRGIDIDGADDVIGFSFASPDGEGETDSVRIFLRVDDQLIAVDVQGVASAEDAEDIAIDLAETELACVLDGDCQETVSLDI